MPDQNYTSKDLEIAEKMGGLTSSIQHLHDKFDVVLKDHEAMRGAIWKRIDSHSEKISNIEGTIKWLIGIGLGFQAGWGILMIWLKKN